MLLEKLAQSERIENTFDINDVTDAIQLLDSLTASTDHQMVKPENGKDFASYSWVQSARQSSVPQDAYFLAQLDDLKSAQ